MRMLEEYILVAASRRSEILTSGDRYEQSILVGEPTGPSTDHPKCRPKPSLVRYLPRPNFLCMASTFVTSCRVCDDAISRTQRRKAVSAPSTIFVWSPSVRGRHTM